MKMRSAAFAATIKLNLLFFFVFLKFKEISQSFFLAIKLSNQAIYVFKTSN